MIESLTDDDLAHIEHRAMRFAGASAPPRSTVNTLAADVLRLLAERRRLLALIAHREERPYWREPHD